MRFNIYGRFQVEVRREGGGWRVYRRDAGKRVPMHDVVLPPDLADDDVPVYLDDVFHEYARHGDTVERLAD